MSLLAIVLLAAVHAAPPLDVAETCWSSPTCEEEGCAQTAGCCHVPGLEALSSAPGVGRGTLATWASAATLASPTPPTHAGVLLVSDEGAVWSTPDTRSLYGHTTTWRDLAGRTLLVITGPNPDAGENAFHRALPASRHRIERTLRAHFLSQGFRAVEGVGDTRLAIEVSVSPDARLHLTRPGVDVRYRFPRGALGAMLHYRPGCPPPALVRAVPHGENLLLLVELAVAADIGDVHDGIIASDGRGPCGRTHQLLVVGEDGQLRIGEQVFPPVLDLPTLGRVEGLASLTSALGVPKETLARWAQEVKEADPAPLADAVLLTHADDVVWSTVDGAERVWRDLRGGTLLRMAASDGALERVVRADHVARGFTVVDGISRFGGGMGIDVRADEVVLDVSEDGETHVWRPAPAILHERLRPAPNCAAPEVIGSVNHARGELTLLSLPVGPSCEVVHQLVVRPQDDEMVIGDWTATWESLTAP